MTEEHYLEICLFSEKYQRRHIMDKNPNAERTFQECQKLIKEYKKQEQKRKK